MMAANKIPSDGCVEKKDLLENLYKFFGIKPLYPSSDIGAKFDAYEFHNKKEPHKAVPKTEQDPKAPFFGREINADEIMRPSSPLFPKIVKENSDQIKSRNKAKISNIMKDDALKFVIDESTRSVRVTANAHTLPECNNATVDKSGHSSMKLGSASEHNGSFSKEKSFEDLMKKNLKNPIWTTEKLRNLEQKMMGRGIRPREQPVIVEDVLPPEKNGQITNEDNLPSVITTHATRNVSPSDPVKSQSANSGNDSMKTKRSRFSPDKKNDISEHSQQMTSPVHVIIDMAHTPEKKLHDTAKSPLGSDRMTRTPSSSTFDEQKKFPDDYIVKQEADLKDLKYWEAELKRKIEMDQEELKQKFKDEDDLNFYVFDHGKDQYGNKVHSSVLREELKVTRPKSSISVKGKVSPTVNDLDMNKPKFGYDGYDMHSPEYPHYEEDNEPCVVLEHPGFNSGFDDDLDVESVSGGSSVNFMSTRSLHNERNKLGSNLKPGLNRAPIDLKNVYNFDVGVSDLPGLLEEKVNKSKHSRRQRKTMPDNYTESAPSSGTRSKPLTQLPVEFSDDYIDLPFEKFIPPVKSIQPIADNSLPSVARHKAVRYINELHSPIHNVERSDSSNYSPMPTLFSGNISVMSNSSLDYKISLPVGGMGLSDDDDEDVEGDDDLPVHLKNRNSETEVYRNRGHETNNGPAAFHRTIRVPADTAESNTLDTANSVYGKAVPSPQRYNFSNKLDSFDNVPSDLK